VDRQTGFVLPQAVIEDLETEYSEDPCQIRDELAPRAGLHIVHQGGQSREGVMQGVIKVYDEVTETGVIVCDDDRSEVLLKPGSLDGSLFRLLRQGQHVVFDLQDAERRVATNLRFGSDGY
jgi:cold shock CspA family protein